MGNIVLPGPALLYVKWGCRRCGHQNGIARTTVPLIDGLSDQREIVEALLVSLRKKLVRKHMRVSGCIATMDDFRLEHFVPAGKTLQGRV
jgi:hypothetical protein